MERFRRTDKELNNMIANKDDWYSGIFEDMGPRPREQAFEILLIGFTSRKHGCTDQNGVRGTRERRVVRGLGEVERERGGGGEWWEDREREGERVERWVCCSEGNSY